MDDVRIRQLEEDIAVQLNILSIHTSECRGQRSFEFIRNHAMNIITICDAGMFALDEAHENVDVA